MTLTRRAALWLEKKIYAGEYPPDMPLPSTRTLAEQFHASQRIILLALDILEKKNILVRQERKRVYVKARSVVDGAREILFFAFGDSIGMHGIYRAVDDMILQVGKQRKYDFFSRVISSADALSEARLDRELARLENLGFIDCALVYCSMDEARMKKFLKLPYPVVFIGELPDSGRLPEGARMISPNSAELLLTAAQYACKRKSRELVLAYWEKPFRRRYEQNSFAQLERFAARRKLPLRTIPIPGENIHEVGLNFEAMAETIGNTLASGVLLAAHNIHSNRFDSGELFPAGKYPGLEQLTLTLPGEDCQIRYVKRDFSLLQRKIVEFIEKQDTEKHVIMDLKYQIMNPKTRMGEVR